MAKVGAHTAVHPLLSGVPFEHYIIIENLFQGYLVTQDEQCLKEIGRYLYPGSTQFLPEHITSILFWVISLKACYARKFPNFFQPAANAQGTQPPQEEIMNAQIRALTQGDVTKEDRVFATDTLRALTELDAIARETEEIKRKYKNNTVQ